MGLELLLLRWKIKALYMFDDFKSDIKDMGVWRGIFGRNTLLRWDVLGAIVPGIFVAVALAMLGLDWFPQNLLISQVFFAIAALLTLLKAAAHAIEASGSRLSRIVFAVVMFCLTIGVTGWIEFSIQNHKHQNIFKDIVRTWMEDPLNREYMAFPVIPPPGDKDSYFMFGVLLNNGRLIQVNRFRREFDRYLLFTAHLNVDAKELRTLSEFSTPEKSRLNVDLKLVLDHGENSGSIEWEPQFAGGVRRSLPLEPYISRDAFLKGLREIDSEADLAEMTINKAIDNHRTNAIKPLPAP